jgi:nicotine blue oxidoreductase
VLLAAGAGTRFGGPKALAELGGERLAERGARLLTAAGCDPVVVVIGAEAERVRSALDVGAAEVERNAAWNSGMGSSLRVGLAALADRCDAAVVALADQPRVTAPCVQRLVSAWRAGAVVAVATYAGAPRNPVLLDASVWGRVAAMAQGDQGARPFLSAYPSHVTPVACDDVGAPDDIDTPEDLAALTKAL